MTVCRKVLIDGLAEVEGFDDCSGTEVEYLVNDFCKSFIAYLAGAVGVDKNRERSCNADSVCDLNLTSFSRACRYDILCNVTSHISRASVNLGGILTGERAAAVGSVSAVGVNDDLTTGKTAVAVRTAYNEATGGVNVNLGVVVHVFCRNGGNNNLADDILADLLEADFLCVLRGNDDSVYANGLVILVFNGNLSFAVCTEVGKGAVLANLGKTLSHVLCKRDRHRHKLGGFVAGKAEYHTLVACAGVLIVLHFAALCFKRLINAHCNVGRLTVDSGDNAAGVAVEALVAVIVADAANGFTCDGLKIGLCGCMVQQQHRKEDIKQKYPYVDFVMGTNQIARFGDILDAVYTSKKRLFFVESYEENPGAICEGLPVRRKYPYRSYVSVMYGCNNFCTYCVVPYVRGRERSREVKHIYDEVSALVKNGCKEITLLGQNVNSYGKDLAEPVSFASLLRLLSQIPGDFVLKFMTSHPKDATRELIDTIAASPKCERHFHLPLQAGSNDILKKMNRKYTIETYFRLCDSLKKKVPGIALTTDIIVGFPGETREEFEETLSLVKEVGFAALFTFIYSPRVGTPAASMPDPISKETKTAWFMELTALQEQVAGERQQARIGTVHRALIELDRETYLEARLQDNTIVRIMGGDASMVGQYKQIKITAARSFVVHGEIVE